MRWMVSVVVLLMGSSASAQSIDDRSLTPVSFPVSTRATDRSVSVYYKDYFDLETEIPFRYAPRVVLPKERVGAYMLEHYIVGRTVVEHCALVLVGADAYRHPETLSERKELCSWLGYEKPEPRTLLSQVLRKKKPPVKKRRRGS